MADIQVKNLDDLLSAYFCERVRVTEVKSKLLTAPGENYGSVMQALEVSIEKSGGKEKLHLVAKLLPVSETLRLVFDIFVTFKKEVDAYTKAIPALIEFQKEFNVPDERVIDFFGKCYGARCSLKGEEVDEDAVILFENLKLQGYENIDRMVGFDFEQAKMILKDLAIFHAVPIALRLLKPEEFEQKIRSSILKYSGFENFPIEMEEAYYVMLKEHLALSGLEDCFDQVVANCRKHFGEQRLEKVAPESNFLTIVHSDYWVNNTMILSDSNGKPLKNKIVDLQIMQFQSAARDLIFFILSSVASTVVDTHYEDLLKIYHKHFIASLSDYNIDLDPYSYNNFLEEIDVTAPKELQHILFMLKPIFTEKGTIESMDNFEFSDMERADVIGEKFTKKLKDVVQFYLNKNWL